MVRFAQQMQWKNAAKSQKRKSFCITTVFCVYFAGQTVPFGEATFASCFMLVSYNLAANP